VPRTGVSVSFVAEDGEGAVWYFDVCGPHTTHRGGLIRPEAVWRALGRAAAVRGRTSGIPLVLLATALPPRPGAGDTAMRAAGPDAFFDAISILSDEGRYRLERYAKGSFTASPQPGFWTEDDLDRQG